MKEKDKIVEDCSHFGIKEPSFPKLEEVETDLTKYEEMWGLFEQAEDEAAIERANHQEKEQREELYI